MQSETSKLVEEWLSTPEGIEWEFALYLTAFNEGYDNALANEYNFIICPACDMMIEVEDDERD